MATPVVSATYHLSDGLWEGGGGGGARWEVGGGGGYFNKVFVSTPYHHIPLLQYTHRYVCSKWPPIMEGIEVTAVDNNRDPVPAPTRRCRAPTLAVLYATQHHLQPQPPVQGRCLVGVGTESPIRVDLLRPAEEGRVSIRIVARNLGAQGRDPWV